MSVKLTKSFTVVVDGNEFESLADTCELARRYLSGAPQTKDSEIAGLSLQRVAKVQQLLTIVLNP